MDHVTVTKRKKGFKDQLHWKNQIFVDPVLPSGQGRVLSKAKFAQVSGSLKPIGLPHDQSFMTQTGTVQTFRQMAEHGISLYIRMPRENLTEVSLVLATKLKKRKNEEWLLEHLYIYIPLPRVSYRTFFLWGETRAHIKLKPHV